ncbi:hypothetical protein OG780_10140 [Streptomyces sp. NBC_00386]|jgi:hypothetical protein|uniref:hypothetical protein n=1 Tax=Streptomyces sp. NBC_00386 TaxID=2975734 RepID=UPI002E25216D
MKRSMIALVSAGAITLALSGYAVGATRHDGTFEQSTRCEQANQEFEARAGQFRKQQQRFAREGSTIRQDEIVAARLKILTLIVGQNPTCFGAGTRAAAAYLLQHPSLGQEGAAACELAGIPSKDCTISVD